MSMRSLKGAIAVEARLVFNNPKLRVKDLVEWSSAPLEEHRGEVIAQTSGGLWVAIKSENDKRPAKDPK